MPIANPTPQQKPVGRNLRRERRRWDDVDTQSLALGCVGCADRELCGGLHKAQKHYSCLDDCCRNPASCDSVCPRNIAGFIERLREINNFDLSNIERTSPCPSQQLPSYVPLIYHRNRRESALEVPFVALPLHKFYSRRSSLLRYTSRKAIEEAFRIGKDTRVLLVGSGRDKPIEAWWGLSHFRTTIISALRDLGIELVTSPNYSLFTDEPRYSDMYNIKRIGIAWKESVEGGVPSALHLNARTRHDYRRLAEFITVRAEVTEVAFEFATGAAWPQRRKFHIENLALLANSVRRDLRLVMIGGVPAITSLTAAYSQITYIDTSPFMNALYRQRLYLNNEGVVKKRPEFTNEGDPVDALLVSNIDLMRAHIESLVSGQLRKRRRDGTARMPKIQES